MTHHHDKHVHCAHPKVKFCAHCQVVYCESCSQEWTPKATWWGTTYTYGNTTVYPGTTGYRSGLENQVLCQAQAGAHDHGP